MAQKEKHLNPENNKIPAGIFIMPAILALILLLSPLFPDIQVSRPKLLVIELGVFCLMVAWLIRTVLAGSVEIRKQPLNLPVLAYALYITIAYLHTENASVAIDELKRMLLCSSVFFLAANIFTTDAVSNKPLRNIVFTGFLIGSGLAMFYGFMQHYGNIRLFGFILGVPQLGRVSSTFGNPIFFAVHLVFLLPILMGVLLYSLQNTKRSPGLFILSTLLAIVFLTGIITLYYTQTRAAWIGFLLSMLFFSILIIKSNKLKVSVIIFSIVFSICFVFLTKDVWTRQQAHLLIWRDTLYMWLHSPIFGTGPGTFHIEFPKYASKELLAIWPQNQRIVNDAHNEYVQLLAETGIIGFGIFLWVIFSFLKSGIRLFNLNRNSSESYIIAGLLCGAAGILVQNTASVDMRFIISAFYLFLAMGLIHSYETGTYPLRYNMKKGIKITLITIILLLSGIIGLDKKPKLHLAAVFHYDFLSNKVDIRPLPEGTGLLPKILEPYLAQKMLSQQPDFFDERILEPVKGIDELLEIQKKYPNETKIYEKLAWIYSKERNFPKAIECYQKAIQINPNLPGVYNNLGNVFFYVNNRKGSIDCYKKSIQIQPNQLDAHLNLGILLYLDGKLKEAAEHFDFVLKIEPGNEKAIVYLKKMRE